MVLIKTIKQSIMKKIVIVIAAAVFFASVFLPQHANAQAPDKMSYQAVVRDANSLLVTNTELGMQISILQGSATGTAVYVETQTPTTNANGLVTLEIGAGTVVTGDFTTIVWTDGPYFIKIDTDLNGGANYTITGTSQLLSVPYALHAKTADSVTGPITETDPVFGASVASGITETDTAYWNNKLDVEVDGDVTNELQILSISNDTIFLTDGGFVELPAEIDPVFGASVAGGITATDTAFWNNHTDSTNIVNMGFVAGPHTDSTDIASMGYIAGGTYSVGDFARGGIVFWVDETGKHGLACAKEDQSSGVRWYAGTYGDTRAKGDGPFSGEMNTAIIIAAHVAIGDDGNTYAARICNELQITEGGETYGDWYLPSKDELDLMYQNKSTINATALANGGSAFGSSGNASFYWSSTESNGWQAWYQSFSNGIQYIGFEISTIAVRAVRAF